MKVRVVYTIEVSDSTRRALGRYNDSDQGTDPAMWSNLDRLATRAEIVAFFQANGYDNGLGILEEYQHASDSTPLPTPPGRTSTLRAMTAKGEPVTLQVPGKYQHLDPGRITLLTDALLTPAAAEHRRAAEARWLVKNAMTCIPRVLIGRRADTRKVYALALIHPANCNCTPTKEHQDR